MDTSRLAVVSVVTAIVLLTVLTGPGVGLISVQESSPFDDPGILTGNATVTAVEFPENPTLSRSASGQYVLRVGDAAVQLASVTGRPGVVYRIDVRYLAYSRTALTVLEPGSAGTRSLKLPKATLAATSIERDRYPARLRLIVRGDGPSREVAATNVTVAVKR